MNNPFSSALVRVPIFSRSPYHCRLFESAGNVILEGSYELERVGGRFA